MKNYLILFTILLLNSSVKSQCNGTEPVIDLGNDTVLCVGQSLTLSVAPGYDYYNWTNGSFQTSTVVSANGTYAVTAGILGQNLVLNGSFQGGTTAASNNFTTAYFPGTGGSFGLLSNQGQFAIATSPSLTHNNFVNCPDHTTGTGNMLVANGASIANTNVWTQTIAVTPNTNYLFSFWQMNVLNSPQVSNLQLFINNVPISGIVPTPTTSCSWIENSGNWNSLGATQAILSIVNQSTVGSGNDFAIDDIYFAPICIATDSITVSYDTIQVNAGEDILFCANESENLLGSANVPVSSYSWSSGQTTAQITPLTAGTYTLTGTSLNGCTATDNVNVVITPMNWNINDILIGNTECNQNNGYVSVLTSGTFQVPPFYTWTGPGANSTNFINASVWDNLSIGWYYLTIQSNGCFRYDSVQVLPNNPPSITLSAAPLSGNYPLTVGFQSTSQNANLYEWDFGNGTSFLDSNLTNQTQVYTAAGVYTAMVIAVNGECSDTAFVTITVTSPPIDPVDPIEPIIPVPVSLETANVFTPNADGINDVYVFKLENIVELDLQILNRWGLLMYTSSSVNASWNGESISGIPAEDGVYFYIFKAKGVQGELFDGHGFVQLIR
jgi:gliding motility-associated-like protein